MARRRDASPSWRYFEYWHADGIYLVKVTVSCFKVVYIIYQIALDVSSKTQINVNEPKEADATLGFHKILTFRLLEVGRYLPVIGTHKYSANR